MTTRTAPRKLRGYSEQDIMDLKGLCQLAARVHVGTNGDHVLAVRFDDPRFLKDFPLTRGQVRQLRVMLDQFEEQCADLDRTAVFHRRVERLKT